MERERGGPLTDGRVRGGGTGKAVCSALVLGFDPGQNGQLLDDGLPPPKREPGPLVGRARELRRHVLGVGCEHHALHLAADDDAGVDRLGTHAAEAEARRGDGVADAEHLGDLGDALRQREKRERDRERDRERER